MSDYNWLTPEEIQRKKARNKNILYVSFLLLAAAFSAVVTILANQI
jgi:hypothetical protein